jgi:hypothetical protein
LEALPTSVSAANLGASKQFSFGCSFKRRTQPTAHCPNMSATYDDEKADGLPNDTQVIDMARIMYTVCAVASIPQAADRAEKQRIIRRKSMRTREELGEAVTAYAVNMYLTIRDMRFRTSEGSKLAMGCSQFEVAIIRRFPGTPFDKCGVESPTAKYLAKMQVQVLSSFGALPVLNWFVLPDDESAGEYEGLAPNGVSAIPVLAHFMGPFREWPARAVVCHLLDPHEARPYARLPAAHTALRVAATRRFTETALCVGARLFNRRVYTRLTAQVVLESKGNSRPRGAGRGCCQCLILKLRCSPWQSPTGMAPSSPG